MQTPKGRRGKIRNESGNGGSEASPCIGFPPLFFPSCVISCFGGALPARRFHPRTRVLTQRGATSSVSVGEGGFGLTFRARQKQQPVSGLKLKLHPSLFYLSHSYSSGGGYKYRVERGSLERKGAGFSSRPGLDRGRQDESSVA